MREADLQVMKKKPGEIYSFSPYPVHLKNVFDNDIFIPHFYTPEAELQVMKKSTPGKIYSFSPCPVHLKKK